MKTESEILKVLEKLERLIAEVREIAKQYRQLAIITILERGKNE